jgi:hypothetical protein
MAQSNSLRCEYYALTARYRTALWVAAGTPMPVKRSRFGSTFGDW